MAARILIVPGANVVLQRIVRQLQGYDGVTIAESGNAALWRVRQSPPNILLADVQLPDIGGMELVEILSALSPNVRLILCGAGTPELAHAVEAKGGLLLSPGSSPDQYLWDVYRALGMAPPPARTATGSLAGSPPGVESAQPAAVGMAPASNPAGGVRAGAGSPPAMPRSQPPPRSDLVAGADGSGKHLAAATTRKPTTSAPEPWMPRSSSHVIRPQQMSVIQKLLETLASDVGAECVLLGDTVGMRLIEVGTVPPTMGPALEPLLATSFSTASQLARLLKEQESRALYLYEGVRYDIYAFNVGAHFILTLIFDKNVNAGKLGSVWVYAKRATRQLQAALER